MNKPVTTSADHTQQVAKLRKKTRGQVRIVRLRCKGCGYCVEFCPTGVLEMSAEFNAKGYHFPQTVDGRDCTGCDLCGMFCPDFAVSGTRGNTDMDPKDAASKE